MKILFTSLAIFALAAAAASARTVQIVNQTDNNLSFVVTSDASNVTQFSQSGSVRARGYSSIEVPDDVHSCKYMLNNGSEHTTWIHAFFMGSAPKEQLVFRTGDTWSKN